MIEKNKPEISRPLRINLICFPYTRPEMSDSSVVSLVKYLQRSLAIVDKHWFQKCLTLSLMLIFRPNKLNM